MSDKIVPITEARRDLFKIAEDVQNPDTRYIVTINGRPEVLIMSFRDHDNLMRAIENMRLQKQANQVMGGASVLAEEPKQKYKVRKR
ncbi:MAG: type II toxin-antitoxin system Phd/YefM family antitoxin [Parcubacteria group bacterium]|nr:type II toxin-antitoxin system Phd/YefM family antitoxin [Parcubacteria group bacterium]